MSPAACAAVGSLVVTDGAAVGDAVGLGDAVPLCLAEGELDGFGDAELDAVALAWPAPGSARDPAAST